MTGFTVGSLIMLGCWLLISPTRGSAPGSRIRGRDRRPVTPRALVSRAGGIDPSEVPLFVHQLTALLRAGRSPHQLWNDMALVYGEDPSTRGPAFPLGFAAHVLPVLAAAHQAAAMGASVPAVLRGAAAHPSPTGLRSLFRTRVPPQVSQLGGLWRDLAACLDVSEHSGAPLAGVLERYAGQLEESLDAAASRATALAGPRATARLLAWLPVIGLGLGYLTGAEPHALLLNSVTGLVILGAGLALMALGRWWTARLIAAAVRDS